MKSLNHRLSQIRSQPKQLFPILVGNFCSRFSSRGIQSLLVLYLLHVYSFSNEMAYTTYAAYTACLYSFAIVGGYLADKFLGYKQSILIGSLLCLVGNALLAFAGLNYIYLALSMVVLGTDLFATNLATLLGGIYQKEDPRKIQGFSLFYMVINMGALTAPFLYGIFADKSMWHFGFLISAALFGIWLFILTIIFRSFGKNTQKQALIGSNIVLKNTLVIVMSLLIIFGLSFLFHHPSHAGVLLDVAGLITLAYILWTAFRIGGVEKINILRLLIMIFFLMCYFAVVFQCYTSLMKFFQDHVNKAVFGFHLPVAAFGSFEPLAVVLLTPFVSQLWNVRGLKKLFENDQYKISLGLFLGVAGLLVFTSIIHIAGNEMVPVFWMFIGTLLFGAGDLCITPTVMAAISTHSPDGFKSIMMGTLYLSMAFSGYISGWIASMTTKGGSTGYEMVYTEATLIMSVVVLISILIGRVGKKWHGKASNVV